MTHTPSPKRPYLLRAYYDWLVDNDFTPIFSGGCELLWY